MDDENLILEQIAFHREQMFNLGSKLDQIRYVKEGYKSVPFSDVLRMLDDSEVLQRPGGMFMLKYEDEYRELYIGIENDGFRIDLYSAHRVPREQAENMFVKPVSNPELIRNIVSIKNMEFK